MQDDPGVWFEDQQQAREDPEAALIHFYTARYKASGGPGCPAGLAPPDAWPLPGLAAAAHAGLDARS